MCSVLSRIGSFHAVYSSILSSFGFFFHSHPTLMSFCTKGLPGVAESIVSKKRRETLSLEGEGAQRADEGGERGTSEILPDHFQNLFSSLKHVMIPEP